MHFNWYKYTYPSHKYKCFGTAVDCSTASPHVNNYFVCDHCNKRRWFESKITSFNSNDITRAEAQQRLKLRDPLKTHKEVVKQQKEFSSRGGLVTLITSPSQLPTVLWNKDKTLIRGLQWPAIFPQLPQSTATPTPY